MCSALLCAERGSHSYHVLTSDTALEVRAHCCLAHVTHGFQHTTACPRAGMLQAPAKKKTPAKKAAAPKPKKAAAPKPKKTTATKKKVSASAARPPHPSPQPCSMKTSRKTLQSQSALQHAVDHLQHVPCKNSLHTALALLLIVAAVHTDLYTDVTIEAYWQ